MIYSKIQYISSGSTAEEHYQHIRQALACGIDWIQLRLKDASPAETRTLARRILQLKENHSFTFIINDSAEVAEEVGADGVHLGLTDMPIAEAKRMLGENKIVGGTANTITDVRQRITEGCDYIGLGPLRYTATKRQLSPILGLEGYAAIMDELKPLLPPPLFAIGGVEASDIEPLRKLGIYGVALSKHLQQHFADENHLEHLKTLLYD
ncbi:MAG TPA: thiamine phosphate synthase [Sphingobacterium sp.]|jgi:thiamine-phosphate pyrophosphorylase|nr:thiamine phosphate synthase [Sphingobacterium sp.]